MSTASRGQRNMAASARLASVDAGRRRKVAAADTSPRLSLVATLAALCFPAFLSSSHALRCSCNDTGVLSDCRWQGWTCTIDPSIGECFARMKVLEDGSIRRDVGCVLTAWNPTFCSSDQTTETYAVQCCGDRDRCNDDLTPTPIPTPTPTFPSSAVSSMPVPQPTPPLPPTVDLDPSSQPTAQVSPLYPPSSTDLEGSGTAATELASTPAPTVSPTPPQDMLRCECTPSDCGEKYCLTDYTCFKNVKYNRDTDTVTTLLGCYYARHRAYGSRVCNGTIDTAANKIRCCDDRDMCNSDLDVPLDRRPATDDSPTIPGTTTSVLPTTTTDTTVVTDDGAGRLKCECSLSLCPEASCLTNYRCFRDVRYLQSSGFVLTRLGCIESIDEVNLDRIGVCDGALNEPGYKIKCCDDREMCNRELEVRLGTDSSEPQTTAEPSAATDDKSGGQGGDDQVYIVLSTAVVLVTMVVTFAVVLTVVGIFFLRYRSEKAKVMSVDQFAPPGIKQLSNGSITSSVVMHSHHLQRYHTEINNYV